MGLITMHVVREDFEEFNSVIKVPFQLMLTKNNAKAQAGGSLCLSKVIQNASRDLLLTNVEEGLNRTNVSLCMEEVALKCLKNNQYLAHTALLESLIVIIKHDKGIFEPYVECFVPELIKMVIRSNQDAASKKCAIDLIYILTDEFTLKIEPFHDEIIKALEPLKSAPGPMLRVREAT